MFRPDHDPGPITPERHSVPFDFVLDAGIPFTLWEDDVPVDTALASPRAGDVTLIGHTSRGHFLTSLGRQRERVHVDLTNPKVQRHAVLYIATWLAKNLEWASTIDPVAVSWHDTGALEIRAGGDVRTSGSRCVFASAWPGWSRALVRVRADLCPPRSSLTVPGLTGMEQRSTALALILSELDALDAEIKYDQGRP